MFTRKCTRRKLAAEIMAVEIVVGRKYGGIFENPPHFDPPENRPVRYSILPPPP
ncbi:MAG: hypothetical protein GY820_40150, partial [Gammaproteobacteria bacterium]|nr:hypothetical protein [Gammaproteobacteria bacterium]